MKNWRLVSTIAVFLAILFLPYWVYLTLLGVAIIFFPFFWEGIILGFLIDVLFGLGIKSFADLFHSYALVALVLVLVLLPVRERIRVHV